MAVFEIALAYTLANEGGFVDDPLDRGGATNMGITQGTLSTYLGRQASQDDVANLSKTVAATIYRKFYWAKIQGDSLTDQAIAVLLFDMAVLMGPTQATKLAQNAVSATPDGLLGPKTLAALNGCSASKFTLKFYRSCVKMFLELVASKPSQLKFLPGWIKRSDEMLDNFIV